VTIDSSTALAPRHRTIDGNCFARSHPQPIAHVDLIERHFLIGAVGTKTARRLGRQFQKRPNGTAGLLRAPQLQHLAQQDENRDHCRGLVVDGDETPILTKPCRECSWTKVAAKLYT